MQKPIVWEGGLKLEILSFETLPSTQIYLTNAIRSRDIQVPTAVIAKEQTQGVGSRNNRWIGNSGDFFVSIAIRDLNLPNDLPQSATSIYFAFLMKELLSTYNQDIWLKWPNDIYLGEKKLGGVMTNYLRSFYVVGIGINFTKNSKEFASINMGLSPMKLLLLYIEELEKKLKWQELFRKYQLEFEKSRQFSIHYGSECLSLENAYIMEDGSIMLNGERILGRR